MQQDSIFDLMYEKYKITKPIRLIELYNNLKIIIDEDGGIYTLDWETIRNNGRPLNTKGRKLKPGIDKYGYYRVTFSIYSKRKSYYVHRLVAMAFLDSYSDSLQVNHKDGNKLNNHYTNLEMVTLQENIRHSILTGLKPKLARDKLGRFSGREVMPNE